ncbi:hypothetical protein [Streptomyces corynorhini]|uniref:Uncharacterized protein n=1 Tax=Streptomyces corynorhini TaxID=2282652 RepID=A0A370BGM2_9ACTN|nr:hypothetical protein [Streptomyces corynorhini]RDG38943.1 hypothetical protein DVH02_06205 [Streptomyces corynorhini]
MPYITRWSAEKTPALHVVATRAGRIGYADERPYDRDSDGVLWTRVPSLPGKGRPEFGSVHALRQQRAMRELLCQVCGRAADRDADGALWLLGEDADDPAFRAADITTTHPPLCLPCALKSVRACPHLRGRYVAVRARRCELAGVRGALYRPGFPAPIAVGVTGVAFGDPRIPWVRAGQLVMRLREFTVTSLERGPVAP